MLRIWKKWSITPIESKPASSAVRAMAASVGPRFSGPSGQLKSGTWSPIFMAITNLHPYSAPDLPGHPAHQLQLLPLLIGGDPVALHGRGETALRAQRQPLQGHVPCGLLDPRLELVLGLQPGFLGGDQAEHRNPVLRQVAEGLEAARAGVVVLEQEALKERLLEDAGDRLVIALRIELALVVAATHVEAEGDPGMVRDDGVVQLDAEVDQLLGGGAPLAEALAHLGVQQRPVLRP